jgi:rhamnosyl/mannosyltransferase
MRICHLAKYYHPACGGIETVVRESAEGLSDCGHQVTVACINHRDRRDRDVTFRRGALTAAVHETVGPVNVYRFGRLSSIARCDVSPLLWWQLPGLLDQDFDVIHLHEPNPAMTLRMWPGLAASKRARRPLVVTYHADACRPRLLRGLFSLVQRGVLRRADRVLCASRSYADASPVLRRITTRVELVPFGINVDEHLRGDPCVEQVAHDLRNRHGLPMWLIVGRLVYYKGHEIAFRALTQVPGKLVVIGAGPLEPKLRKLATRLRIDDRVVWLGSASNEIVRGAYRAATALWFPSTHRSEAFGLAQVEAMASGCPVINTAIPGSGVPEVSLDRESGLTVPCGDPHALAAAARLLSERTELRDELSHGARRRACCEFDRSQMVDKLCAVYESVLRQRKRKKAARHVVAKPSPSAEATVSVSSSCTL